MRDLRSAAVVALLVLGLGLLALSRAPGGRVYVPALAATHQVSINAGEVNTFTPNPITINVGDTVTWTNLSTTPRTINFPTDMGNNPPTTSGFIYQNGSYSKTFNSAGTFGYKSTTTVPNPTGQVVVQSGGGGGGGTATPTPTQCSGGGGSASVTINDGESNTFSPQVINISPGTTVTWTNVGTTPRTINFPTDMGNNPPTTSGFIYQNGSYSKSFPSAGTFGYKSTTTVPNPTGQVVVSSGGCGGGGATNTPTNTPGVPTATNTPTIPGPPTSTPTRTNTPPPGSTNTPTPTKTPTAPPGATSTPTPTNTPTTPSGGAFPAMGVGWNLVTYAGASGPAATSLGPLGNAYSIVYFWDGAKYQRFVRPGAWPSYLNTMSWMTTGGAYWIYMTAPVP